MPDKPIRLTAEKSSHGVARLSKLGVPCSIEGYSFAVGYQTGLLNRVLKPPEAVDRYSFYAGIIEGKAKRQEYQTIKMVAKASHQRRKPA